ncbi:hypothetical protein EDD16DRAFT_793340 [Pisolithus croceorrhizus]|nr:hypothetical protein EDD16DRAFT_793340 [Pisolithus croceorrhizus]
MKNIVTTFKQSRTSSKGQPVWEQISPRVAQVVYGIFLVFDDDLKFCCIQLEQGAMYGEHVRTDQRCFPMYSISPLKSHTFIEQTLRAKKQDSFPVILIGSECFETYVQPTRSPWLLVTEGQDFAQYLGRRF